MKFDVRFDDESKELIRGLTRALQHSQIHNTYEMEHQLKRIANLLTGHEDIYQVCTSDVYQAPKVGPTLIEVLQAK